ncbi:undecaprenyl-diphosphate phosphatase [Candidatus Micrarchaeota archaeon]|nr:undecaprenyl-diphosphate phosphatase [Candidatus Micrarchaeota archaeon]
MDLIQALLLGALQGITEWLPVSSSGHLVLVQHFFGVSASVFFYVALHLGTLAAVALFFRRQIVDLFLRERKMLVLLVLASIPAALAGFLLRDFFASLFSSVLAVGIAFVFTGCLLYATKRASGNNGLNARNSLLIGLLQAVSIIPGVSRSGATISAGLLAGVEKKKATTFSFLLSIPVILGAAAFEAWKGLAFEPNLTPVFVGVVAAFVVGFASIGWLLKLIEKKEFYVFAFYCWLVGAVAVVAALLG